MKAYNHKKELYIIRHCEAEGQQASALLTHIGKLQAEQLDYMKSLAFVPTI